MSQCNLGEPWRVQMNADIRQAAEKHKNLKLIFKDAQNDTLRQRAHVEEFVSAKVDLLIISPKEAAPLTEPVARAMPGLLHHPGFRLDRIMEFVFIATDGMTGLIFNVFATFIVIFVVLGAFLQRTGLGVLIITHHERLLEFNKPHYTHVMLAGRIVETGDAAYRRRALDEVHRDDGVLAGHRQGRGLPRRLGQRDQMRPGHLAQVDAGQGCVAELDQPRAQPVAAGVGNLDTSSVTFLAEATDAENDARTMFPDDLPRLHEPERQAVRVGIVHAVPGHARLLQIGAGGCQRQPFLDVAADVHERRDRRAVGRERRQERPAESAAGRNAALPHAGEVGLAVGQPRRGGVEVRPAIRSARHVGRRERRPLRRKTHGACDHQHHQRKMNTVL